MVASRKPSSVKRERAPANRTSRGKPPARRKRETIDEKFERVLAEPFGTPIHLTKREAIAFLRRLAGSRDDLPPGQQIIDDFYGLNSDGTVKRKSRRR